HPVHRLRLRLGRSGLEILDLQLGLDLTLGAFDSRLGDRQLQDVNSLYRIEESAQLAAAERGRSRLVLPKAEVPLEIFVRVCRIEPFDQRGERRRPFLRATEERQQQKGNQG